MPFGLSMNQIAISGNSNPHQWFCDILPKNTLRHSEWTRSEEKVLSEKENYPQCVLRNKWQRRSAKRLAEELKYETHMMMSLQAATEAHTRSKIKVLHTQIPPRRQRHFLLELEFAIFEEIKQLINRTFMFSQPSSLVLMKKKYFERGGSSQDFSGFSLSWLCVALTAGRYKYTRVAHICCVMVCGENNLPPSTTRMPETTENAKNALSHGKMRNDCWKLFGWQLAQSVLCVLPLFQWNSTPFVTYSAGKAPRLTVLFQF
jgi:hypothetical protein